MQAMIEKVLNNTIGEQFENPEERVTIVSVLSFVIIQLLLLTIGKYLFNNCLCKITTICKPVNSIWTLLGAAIVIKMIFG